MKFFLIFVVSILLSACHKPDEKNVGKPNMTRSGNDPFNLSTPETLPKK